MNRALTPRSELFSQRVRREVLDDLSIEELVRLSDAHNLSVQFAPPSRPRTDADALLDVCLYDPTDMLYGRTIDANDPLWEAFGGFVAPHDGQALSLEDLALFHEWRFRKDRLEREGYFVEVERLYRERRQRVHRAAELLVAAIEKAMDEADGPQALLIDGWDGSLRSVTEELRTQLAEPSYPDSLSIRVFVGMAARLKELGSAMGESQVTAQAFARLANLFDNTRKLIESYAYRSFRKPGLPAWHETSSSVRAEHMPSYSVLLHRAARGTDPRSLLPWFDVPAKKLVEDPNDWRIAGLCETFELILKETPSSPPLPVSVPARASDRPPAETLPGTDE